MNRTDVDALARLLDGDPTLNGEATEETRLLGRLAHELSTQPVKTVALRPELKAALRAELIETARRQATDPTLLARLREGIRAAALRWRYSSRMAAATGATALALSSGGVAVAADQAQPNDMLYPVKLVLEDMRVALVRDDASRGQRHLAHAAERIEEAEAAATDRNDAGAAVALYHADVSTRRGAGDLIRTYQRDGDPAHVATLGEFADEQRARLRGLSPLLGGEALQAARDLVVALERIEVRMLAVTGTCDGCARGPGGGDGFDFATIPPADADFLPCRCVLPGTGSAPEPLAPADAEESGPAAPSEARPERDENVEQPGSVEAPPTESPASQHRPSVPTPGEGPRPVPPPDPVLPSPSAPDERAPLNAPDLEQTIKSLLED